VSVTDATINPKPVQQPSIPIWVGASGEKRSLPMVAKWADAWHCFGGVDYLGPKNRVLDGMCDAAGRDPSTLLRAASISVEGPVDDARREIDAWRDAGFGYLIAGWPSGGRAQVESFAAVLSDV
jgi:alkanesulfonate monooxygenase SsuD/methylene tetrahydromethanopterin reductase-like flavin-dependent oxidoreductase (luciferase family)